MKALMILTWIVTLLSLQGCTHENRRLQERLDPLSSSSVAGLDQCRGEGHIQVPETIAKKCRYAKAGNCPRLLTGTNGKAVILLHGFMGSPFEVSAVAEALHDAGYTVFSPLVYGFGGDDRAANNASMMDWRATLGDSIAFLSPRYNELALAGFSLGGTIVMDYVLSGMPRAGNASVNAVVLIAPYYKANIFAGRAIHAVAKIFSDSISLKNLYRLSRHTDLVTPLNHPQHYNINFPLNAVSEMFKFEDALERIPSSVQSDIPALLITSGYDNVIDRKALNGFINGHFKNVRRIHYERSRKVRHQIPVPEANPYLKEMNLHIRDFINSRGK